jgi:hypothetical protein
MNRLRKAVRSKIQKSRPEQSCLCLIVRIVTALNATGDEGPDLHKVTKTDERIKSQILNGVKGEMPAFGKKLTQDDVATLVVFIRSLSGK